LSYTSFEYSNPELSQQILHDSILITAEITNTGKQAGSELVQLYVRDLVGSLTRPVRELKGFQRIELQPGESQHVSFSLTEEMLAFTRADGSKGVEPGVFQVWIAPNSASGLCAEFSM
jgi:beta-glucosidase